MAQSRPLSLTDQGDMVKLMPEMDADTKVYDTPGAGWPSTSAPTWSPMADEGTAGAGSTPCCSPPEGGRPAKKRRTALIYGRDRDRYLVVGSNGGAAKHPQWYLNLVEDPRVDVQVGAEKFSALAHTATPEEKPGPWQRMASIWPEHEKYQQRTTREIPVVIIEPLEKG